MTADEPTITWSAIEAQFRSDSEVRRLQAHRWLDGMLAGFEMAMQIGMTAESLKSVSTLLSNRREQIDRIYDTAARHGTFQVETTRPIVVDGPTH